MAKFKENTFKSVDKLSQELDLVDNFVLKNWKYYVYLSVAVVIILGIVFVCYATNTKKNLQESLAIQHALTITDYENLLNKYHNSQAIDYARLKLAGLYYENAKYKDALNLYQKEIESSTAIYPVSYAKINIAFTLEAMNKKQDAVAKFEQIGSDTKIPLAFRCEANYSAGRLYYELGNKNKAITCLNLVVSQKDNCIGWPQIAKSMLDRIK